MRRQILEPDAGHCISWRDPASDLYLSTASSVSNIMILSSVCSSRKGKIATDLSLFPDAISSASFRNKRSKLSCSFLLRNRSEEHTSELQSLMRISYAVFCLKKKNTQTSLYILT